MNAIEKLEYKLREGGDAKLNTLGLSVKTPLLSTVHRPLGKPGGPGLFHVKGMQLPAYIRR